jgi:hypothetical protein
MVAVPLVVPRSLLIVVAAAVLDHKGRQGGREERGRIMESYIMRRRAGD